MMTRTYALTVVALANKPHSLLGLRASWNRITPVLLSCMSAARASARAGAGTATATSGTSNLSESCSWDVPSSYTSSLDAAISRSWLPSSSGAPRYHRQSSVSGSNRAPAAAASAARRAYACAFSSLAVKAAIACSSTHLPAGSDTRNCKEKQVEERLTVVTA